MDTKYFSLSPEEGSKVGKILRVIFGIICIAIAVFWFVFNIRSLKADKNLWITILFLSAYGSYQMWAGFGRAISFIEIAHDYILLKKSTILPSIKMDKSDIAKIEMFPLNIIFYYRKGRKIYLRFGTSFNENIESVRDEIIKFASENNIIFEIKTENI